MLIIYLTRSPARDTSYYASGVLLWWFECNVVKHKEAAKQEQNAFRSTERNWCGWLGRKHQNIVLSDDQWTLLTTKRWMDGCMHACMHAWMDAWIVRIIELGWLLFLNVA